MGKQRTQLTKQPEWLSKTTKFKGIGPKLTKLWSKEIGSVGWAQGSLMLRWVTSKPISVSETISNSNFLFEYDEQASKVSKSTKSKHFHSITKILDWFENDQVRLHETF